MGIKSRITARLKKRAIEHGKSPRLWRKIGNPDFFEWAEYLKRHGAFQSFGEDCAINPESIFTDPYLTSIGDRVWIAGAFVSGHDGSVNVLNNIYGTRLDAVGPVVIGDDVFIGRGSSVMPNTHIGPRCIIGAGSVVSGKFEGDCVIAGAPAQRIRSMDEHLEIVKRRNDSYSWRHLVEQRDSGHDDAMEPELHRMRIAQFFGKGAGNPG